MNNELHIAIRVILSVGLFVLYVPLAAQRDDIATDLNGSLDTLKKKFHGLGAKIRTLVFGVVGVLAYYPIPAAIVAYFVLSAAYFWCLFDPKLNIADHKPRNYVSRQVDAAFTDRFLVWLAAKVGKEPEDVAAPVKMAFLGLSLIVYTWTVIHSYTWRTPILG
jgi:hypothetical protein